MQLERRSCAPELAPWVENYWSLRWDLPPGTSYLSSTLPHPACNLTVERGHLREEVGPDPVVVTGVATCRFDVTLRDRGWVFGVKFRPGGLASLTGADARRLRDETVPAMDLVPAEVVEPLRALGPSMSSYSCSQAADAALMRLPRDPDPDYDTLLSIVSMMLADRSLVRVAQVEEHCAVNARRLQRLFARYVGVGPKWVLARYRIHDALTDLHQGYAGSLADLAARYGWFDQAHFTREFTELVGTPPGAYQADTDQIVGRPQAREP